MSVLVVDDQPLNRILLGKLLRSLDLHVIEAGDGRAGLEAYLQYGRSVALVFMDLVMPVLGGIEAVVSIRSAESRHGWQAVPIVAYTSEDVAHGSALWQQCMASGFNDVVPKPVSKRYATQLLCRWMPGLQVRCSGTSATSGTSALWGASASARGNASGTSGSSSSNASSDDEIVCGCGEPSASCSKCGSSAPPHAASAAAQQAGRAACSGSGSEGASAEPHSSACSPRTTGLFQR